MPPVKVFRSCCLANAHDHPLSVSHYGRFHTAGLPRVRTYTLDKLVSPRKPHASSYKGKHITGSFLLY
jgi:hypothetical protein